MHFCIAEILDLYDSDDCSEDSEDCAEDSDDSVEIPMIVLYQLVNIKGSVF